MEKTVYGRLTDIYEKYGFVLDRNHNFTFSGISAMADMNAVVHSLKKEKITKMDIYDVVAVRDYLTGKRTSADGTVTDLDIKGTNCIYYEIENGSFVCIRPSGTEPKLKIYYSIKAQNREQAEKAQAKISACFEKYIK